MKNNQAMSLSTLATATRLELEVADTQGKVTYTKLAPAKPRRANLYANQVGGGSTRWHNATGGNGRLKAGQLRPDEIALKAALR